MRPRRAVRRAAWSGSSSTGTTSRGCTTPRACRPPSARRSGATRCRSSPAAARSGGPRATAGARSSSRPSPSRRCRRRTRPSGRGSRSNGRSRAGAGRVGATVVETAVPGPGAQARLIAALGVLSPGCKVITRPATDSLKSFGLRPCARPCPLPATGRRDGISRRRRRRLIRRIAAALVLLCIFSSLWISTIATARPTPEVRTPSPADFHPIVLAPSPTGDVAGARTEVRIAPPSVAPIRDFPIPAREAGGRPEPEAAEHRRGRGEGREEGPGRAGLASEARRTSRRRDRQLVLQDGLQRLSPCLLGRHVRRGRIRSSGSATGAAARSASAPAATASGSSSSTGAPAVAPGSSTSTATPSGGWRRSTRVSSA